MENSPRVRRDEAHAEVDAVASVVKRHSYRVDKRRVPGDRRDVECGSGGRHQRDRVEAHPVRQERRVGRRQARNNHEVARVGTRVATPELLASHAFEIGSKPPLPGEPQAAGSVRVGPLEGRAEAPIHFRKLAVGRRQTQCQRSRKRRVGACDPARARPSAPALQPPHQDQNQRRRRGQNVASRTVHVRCAAKE